MSSKKNDRTRSTPRDFSFRTIELLALIATALLLSNCAEQKPKKPVAEAVPQASANPASTEAPQQTAKVITPEAAKVQEAVTRVFKDTVMIDTNQKSSYVSGDFNGDLSADLAVVVKPVPEKLGSLNEEYPPWILKDPFAAAESAKSPLHVAEQETLLAVIHGYGDNGWTDPQATQTYLLKNSAGADLQARPGKDFVTAHRGKPLPQIHGDLIGEVLNGASGYLYYSRATYAWYDPKTFKGEVIPRNVHMGAGPGTKKGATK